jgi:serine/threonine protein kinase
MEDDMNLCPVCSQTLSDDDHRCPACGAALDDSSTPTRMPQAAESPAAAPLAASPGSAPALSQEGRLIAGTMLAGRYRIVSLLGRGGMGEVYKADDLKLNQPVALKFLPDAFALDGAALARFHNEVRVARQVAHPNVCRVYDIGEVEGRHFLSMEFIDGEDLSSLLRRIGRLPGDKAIEIARQMCAGLAAAHDLGVLHRDLKPANVMIDGRGKARITDFGLAVVSEELRADDLLAGTPAYMAPEQLAGKEVTTRSDIYALGLVLYELFTGKRVYDTQSLHELKALHEQSTPATPSSHVKDIDPLAERVILRCLEKEPKRRPASAVQVALALPGGDPLQAALALGETPSPEMVAASGEKTGLRPMVAVACLAAVIVGLFLTAWINSKVSLIERVPLDPPDSLTHRAREISARFGYPEPPADTSGQYQYNTDYLKYVIKNDPSPTRWNRLQFPAITFAYTESPQDIPVSSDIWGMWIPDTPSFTGIIQMRLDPQGRLRAFSTSPTQVSEAAVSVMDWTALFREAGLDPTRFTSAEPQWTPPFAFDERAAWTGVAPQSDVPLRIEAAAWHGKPIFFQLIYPWTPSTRVPNSVFLGPPLFGTILNFIIVVGAAWVAWSNYRRGKGDPRGASKLAGLVFVLFWLFRTLLNHHAPTIHSLANTMFRELSIAAFYAATTWLVYFAYEPFLRRYWPASVISWNRVLAGRLRDSLVGRDVLIGTLFGISTFLMRRVIDYLIGYQDVFVEHGTSVDLVPLKYNLFGAVTMLAQGTIVASVLLFFWLFLLRVLLRRPWLAVSLASLLLAVPQNMQAFAYRPFFAVPAIILLTACAVFLCNRFGLVSTTAAMFAYVFLGGFPLTPNFSAWYFGIGLIGPLMVLALGVYGFYTSLGGQPLFTGKLLEE